MTGRGRAVLATGLLVVIVTAACTSATDVATTRAVDALVPVPTEAPTTPSTRTLAPCEEEHAAEASYPALDAVPAPHQMPADSAMERIQNEEELVVGVDESTKYFSTREGNGFVGFEPDLARLIARSIFGDHGKVTFVPVVTEDKTKVVMNGDVDMTIDVVSKTCKRWGEVDFSSTYYETSQRILGRSDSPIKGVADL
jgi:polar amino acid transport system substrate-binding protein